MLGARVLAIDLDPQFALTRRFGISPAATRGTVFELLAGEGEIVDAIVREIAPHVDLLAARRELAKLELSLAGEHHRERFLADLLAGEIDAYDLVLIDCPPSLGLLTVNAFVATSGVVIPVDMTDEGALQGAVEVGSIVRRLARADDVAIRALIRTKVDCRRIVYQQMNAALRELGMPVARTEIPLTAAFQNAAAERLPLVAWLGSSPGALAYRELATELSRVGAIA